MAALGVYRAADELGLSIPGDVSLVGYYNTAIASLAPVRLTSVDQAGRTMGATAARMLIARVEGRRDRAMQTTMPPPAGRPAQHRGARRPVAGGGPHTARTSWARPPGH
ncbi:substrate-binding domain-containing protein [Streptomyces sp. NPDC006307]|uniref:substrate-binding domain-containing protein n=1 Tax=Streptomyces sp. NPDC006307 TaxID=3156748 RepID=UPI0033A09861